MNYTLYEKFHGIHLPNPECIRNIRVLADGNVAENKVAE